MTVLITGGEGTLGRELVTLYPKSVHPSHAELDIGDKAAVDALLQRVKPEVILHSAARTGVKECENNKPLAWRANVEGTENLVQGSAALSNDCYFIYVSTACVFQGDRGNYVESDLPNPKNYYALTKLLGEAAVRNSSLKRWLIVRTNFVAREKWRYPKAFADRYGTYLFADDVARAIRDVTAEDMRGILHVAGSRRLSMLELAKLTTPEVLPMTLEEYRGPPLTVDMTLQSERIPSIEITATWPKGRPQEAFIPLREPGVES